MKKISVLGSTGSIGTQTLEVARNNKDLFQICSITAQSNIDILVQQAIEFQPELVVIEDERKYKELKERVGHISEVACGVEGLIQSAVMQEVDTVVSSIVGIAGLLPTYNAVLRGKNIALANKETLVTAGRIIMRKAKENGVEILPVDSEHSAIFQSIGSNNKNQVQKLILTASGGPFRNKSLEELQNVTIADALAHPNWSMGKKITIDSATLMNKGLEVIEAKWLFDMDLDKIEVCVHPQSIIHSLVEFIDGSVLAQLGLPDMKLPIQYALTYPDRFEIKGKRLNLAEISKLTFENPDTNKFSCLRLAYDALRLGDSACIVVNGANEIAVELFLAGKIKFLEISRLIEKTLEVHEAVNCNTIEEVIEIDNWARIKAKELYEMRCI